MTTTPEGRRRLAERVKAERMQKFRTVDKARIAAGISRGAWENVEAGRSVKDFTVGAVEDALGWPPGRAQQIIDGDGESTEDYESAVRESDLSPAMKERVLRALAATDAEPTEGRRSG